MEAFLDFLRTDQAIALIAALLIFLVTIILVVRGSIGFAVTLLLLIFSIVAGLVINHHEAFEYCFRGQTPEALAAKESTPHFETQILQAIQDLKAEVATEKESLQHVVNQVQEILDQVESEKQKLQSFIEETKDHFKTESKPESANQK